MNDKELHSGHRDRLRKKFRTGGLDVLDDHEVIEMLLTLAIPRRDVNPISHRLLAEFGTLSAVLDASPEDLQKVDGIGPQAAFMISLMPALSRRYMLDRLNEKPLLTNIAKAGEYAGALFIGAKTEILYLLCLDNRCGLKRAIRLHDGDSTSVSVNIQKLISETLRIGAQNVILAHNHPANVLLPSADDIEMTNRISQALSLINVQLVDHIIVSDHGYYSFAENRVFNRTSSGSPFYAHEDTL